ncbi:hypothetical protein CsSME_00035024 [Camellia sinensis var. sinensis]
MEVLALVLGYSADRAGAELLATKSELDTERRKAILLEFELAGEKRKVEQVQQACTTANERWEEAMANNEELRDQAIKDKDNVDGQIAELEKALAKEMAKLASERAAYHDLCMVDIEQFKGSADF